jgi:hypothetical protein
MGPALELLEKVVREIRGHASLQPIYRSGRDLLLEGYSISIQCPGFTEQRYRVVVHDTQVSVERLGSGRGVSVKRAEDEVIGEYSETSQGKIIEGVLKAVKDDLYVQIGGE